jgi:hypothetical protein
LFFSHHSLSGDLFIIFSFMGMCQGDPFVGHFFLLVHFCVLHYFQAFSPWLFPSSVDHDTHILGLA